jgi:hypothetical protein
VNGTLALRVEEVNRMKYPIGIFLTGVLFITASARPACTFL